jgi:hypothetical protein
MCVVIFALTRETCVVAEFYKFEGIYRVPGRQSRLEALRDSYDKGKEVDWWVAGCNGVGLTYTASKRQTN